jgi:hypothetical protein
MIEWRCFMEVCITEVIQSFVRWIADGQQRVTCEEQSSP